MQVILKEDLPNLGAMGSIVKVKDGYARNYLLPRALAIPASESNQRTLDHQIKMLERKRSKAVDGAKKLAATLDKTSVTVTKQVGEDERIFGSVTTSELAELLKAEGIEIDKKLISLTDDVKKVGVYSAEVKLHPEVTAKFKVWVVAQ